MSNSNWVAIEDYVELKCSLSNCFNKAYCGYNSNFKK